MKQLNGFNTPALWQKIEYIIDSLDYMDRGYQRYGDIFKTPIIGNAKSSLLISNPQALQQVFTRETKEFITPANTTLQILVGDYSIFMLEGDRHQRERKLLMPPFHGERMRIYAELICDLTNNVMKKITPGVVFTAREVMQEISLEVILKVVFGVYQGERFAGLKQLITTLMNSFKSPLMSSLLFLPFLRQDLGKWSPWGYFRSFQQEIAKLIYAEISDRRQNYDPSATDILTLLISARDETGQGMTDIELHDELITLLFAGHETTATAIAWALYWVHYLPEIREKLLAELANLDQDFAAITISKLPYLNAVCNETLRIHPVVVLTSPREVKEPVTLMGYELTPGTRIYGSIHLIHHRQDIYPNSREFKPERFLERKFSPYEFFPFGGGNRRCIGEALAMLEMKLVLATILSNYQLKLATNQPEISKRRGVTLAPKNGVKMMRLN